MKSVFKMYQNCGKIQGRTTRAEYLRVFFWFYIVISSGGYLIAWVVSLFSPNVGQVLNYTMHGLMILSLPALISEDIRRLHDLGKSGWNMLWFFTGIGAVYFITLMLTKNGK